MINKNTFLVMLMGGLTSILLISGVTQADDVTKTDPDCPTANVDYINDPTLTRAEKIVLMEQALTDSLNRFQLCDISISSNSASNGSAGGGQAGSSGSGEGSSSSVASDAMQGTESEAESSPNVAGSADVDPMEEETSSSTAPTGKSLDNGRLPEDIPPADNDDAIAAQIRVAAESETDPEIRKKLWNEYRKYKGMNVEQ
ncbi:MAG TPA: hypothetical protein ENI26_08655 [Methylophaga aminisulfidivorans]|uniref:Secreted protein n=2 Tax=root TaxID=1 RepID=A0A7C1ZHP9_9GAMM|nr:hypothetical protein [Methylophaga aminisulfidivorans]